MNPIKSEPTAIVAGVMGAVYILAAFGIFPTSPEQQKVLQDNLLVVLTGGGALMVWLRSMVTAPDTVEDVKEESFAAGAVAAKAGAVDFVSKTVVVEDPYVSDLAGRDVDGPI